MDAQIKRRMVNDVIIYPFIKYSCGDKVFGEAINLKGMLITKVSDSVNVEGESYVFQNKVIIDGNIEHIITTNDEIELKYIGRVPVRGIAAYNSLRPGCELIEVYC
ncbi:MAG TPA: hypothetical protein IAC02_03010 [Candidatus Coprovivens excrementavium]|nr:hypothetical protein [Candidatus Coprovivens excrementavium]